jgi:signal transduction histidine kinase
VKLAGGQVEAKIEDRGRGIHWDPLNETTGKMAPLGAGIQSMKERLRQFDGKLEIDSRINQGTVITATVPLSPQLSDGKQKSSKGNQPSTTRIV